MSDQHAPEVFIDKTPDLGYDLEDFGMSADDLEAKYGNGPEDEHPEFTRDIYADKVGEGETMSYWDWVAAKIAKDDEVLPGNDEQGNPLPTAADPKQEMVEMTDLDVFAGHLFQWHDRQKKLAEHFLTIPEGTETEVQIGENDERRTIKLEGDVYHGFRAGLAAALNLFGSLPFAVLAKDSPEANALLQPADITDPAQAHGG